MTTKANVSLGLGLLSIGRAWGHVPGQPPPEAQARDLLDYAVGAGITFFDTAPAYGTSERIFGAFLRDVGARAKSLTIATKMGEHWVTETNSTRIDHSYDAMCRSIDRSLAHLGRVDLLQLHLGTLDNVAVADTLRAIDYARTLGIKRFGANVRDVATGERTITSGAYDVLHFTYNTFAPALAPLFAKAAAANMDVLINRPYAMGRLQAEAGADPIPAMHIALRFVRAQPFKGVILTGTRSAAHLRQSVEAFAGSEA
jgi:aryl-alcohol dehydrogenase-like predicted oxidoreductase